MASSKQGTGGFELLALVPTPVYVERLDDQQVVFANDSAGVLLGLGQDAEASCGARELFAESAVRKQFVDRLQSEGSVTEFEATLVALSGERMAALLSARAGKLDGSNIAVVSLESVDDTGLNINTGIHERDLLTGLHGRPSFAKIALREFERARRYERMMCLALIDVDGLRKVNDEHGFLCGDEVFAAIAKATEACVREVDVVARYGDDEFAVLLPETGVEGGSFVLDRLRVDIESQRFSDAGLAVTVTVGVSELLPEDDGLMDLVGRAQVALKAAKSKGGNCVRAY